MLYGSRISKKKVYHYGDCRYSSKLMKGANRISFATVEEAVSRGYSQCTCCSRIPSEFRKNRKEIIELCETNGLQFFFSGEEMIVISRDDTAWKICMIGDGSKKKCLLHESKRYVSYDRKLTAYEDRKYHEQDVPNTSISGYLTYIYRHDLSEECREKQEKKKQVEKALLREQVNSIRAVQTQINKQNRKKKGTKESNSVKRRRNKQNLRNIANAFRDYKAAAAAHI